jgi:DNA-binding CsgD family transcriptional regulator
LNILPAIQTHAKIRFRKLPAERRDDAIQEAIAAACVNYQLLAARGQLDVAHPSTLADFAVRHVRIGRHVGGRQDPAKDVLSPVARDRHGVRVHSYHCHCSGDGTDGWRQVAIAERKASIPDTAAFRIDFGEWLRTLTRRDRKIIFAFVRGERTSAVAERFGISEGRVSQLRRKYEHLWQAFQRQAIIIAA